ncbi:hypothetical protein HNS38_02030 [Lentimicrobium sp. L6]|nr:hypothetical protein [Lentimicrobium sp. L6]NPD83520.1 hypothetical protein [Lentimicrobium sp. L6]
MINTSMIKQLVEQNFQTSLQNNINCHQSQAILNDSPNHPANNYYHQ